jgi:hypothetical protein
VPFRPEVDAAALRRTLVGVAVVNVPGYLLQQRRFVDGTDLNHIMPGESAGNAPQVYAHRLLERVVRRFDYLIDLHTASFGRINSLYVRADMTHAVAARMAYLQRPQIIVHNPASDRTLFTVEIGLHNDSSETMFAQRRSVSEPCSPICDWSRNGGPRAESLRCSASNHFGSPRIAVGSLRLFRRSQTSWRRANSSRA